MMNLATGIELEDVSREDILSERDLPESDQFNTTAAVSSPGEHHPRCGAWYTSDDVKVEDCDDFKSTGECDEKEIVREERSDASGSCDDCAPENGNE
ncbi:hypothetical protein DL766_001556 [Monosporascus sp. MC13-8B]|uniref:Glucosidase II beta subunit N-terminal domain-containing protein n=1 Tax=Monosporascus cannonballus TaxID=155416 RepID=A0ABY0GY16_9PEZI|nr:hypothetical protein DL762_007824 [Monosporascus cannonballus]RYO90744.1 hypothetical protein DL763_005213 [Monosporascus cannonballus]RYP37405.1 hypothetical protein DL766_001556 [Monosporascus sp. MC13-8B]